MQRKLQKIIRASLSAFTDDDKMVFLNLMASKYKSLNINDIHFTPYKSTIIDAYTFYENATITFLVSPIDIGDSFLLAEESFRQEETLVLRKSDGIIYYNSYTKPSIPVATSFLELWTSLESRRKENIYNNEKVIERSIPLELKTQQTIRQCFIRDSFEEIRAIYETINNDERICEFPYYCCGIEGITEFNFYKKANFSLDFPFELIDKSTYDLPEGTWWEIGHSYEDEDTGPDDDGFLLMDSNTGRIIRCSVDTTSQLLLGNSKNKMLSSFIEIFPLCLSLLRFLFCAKKTPIKVDYFKVADTFKEFINRLSVKVSNRFQDDDQTT